MLYAKILHERNVLFHAVEVIATDIARMSFENPAVRRRTDVPTVQTFIPLVRRAFNLIGCSRNTPRKILFKTHTVSPY